MSWRQKQADRVGNTKKRAPYNPGVLKRTSMCFSAFRILAFYVHGNNNTVKVSGWTCSIHYPNLCTMLSASPHTEHTTSCVGTEHKVCGAESSNTDVIPIQSLPTYLFVMMIHFMHSIGKLPLDWMGIIRDNVQWGGSLLWKELPHSYAGLLFAIMTHSLYIMLLITHYY